MSDSQPESVGTSETKHIEDLYFYEAMLLFCAELQVDVRIRGRLHPTDHLIEGMFDVQDNGSEATIYLYRDHQQRIPDLRATLFTLVHEMGHALSRRDGNVVARYVERLLDDPSAIPITERRAAYEEEERAWRHARTLLVEKGYPNLDALITRTAESLESYREKFGL